MNKKPFTIGVFGLGHVGLPTALCLAELGWQVIGADEDPVKVSLIKSGQVPFHEPRLQELLSKHLDSQLFQPTEDVDEAVRSALVLFLCVGTPQRNNGEADLSQVEAIARTIARNRNGYKLIVEKSTVPAITAQWVKRTIQRYAPAGALVTVGEDSANISSDNGGNVLSGIEGFDVASNPEFLQEGKAIDNFFHPDRIVCGVESEKAREILLEIYQPLNCPILITNLTTAELIKHAANAFLSMKISFINMVSDLCEAVGADGTKVAHGIGLDPRIGSRFLHVGIGFGGYCLPKDLRSFIHLAEEHGLDFSMLEEVERINQKRIDLFLRKLRKALWIVRGKTICVLGLAFKPNTDDIREAPSLKIIERLLEEGAIVQLYDPQAVAETQRVYPEQPGRVSYCKSAYEAAQGAHALLLLTEWDEFRELDLERIRSSMTIPIVVDGRNLFDPERMQELGFEYFSMGRGGGRVVNG